MNLGKGEKRAFFLFVMISGFAALVNLGSRIFLDKFTNYEIAIAGAYLVGMTTAFYLNRRFLFQPKGTHWWPEMVRFSLVNCLALAQIFIVSEVLYRLVFPSIGLKFYPDVLAHAIGLASPIFTSYWAHKHYTFRSRAGGIEPLEPIS